ncbi:Qat anti-phage system QueC-like protein QatC [Pseudodesulfovibrio sediminis]|uniref:DNA-binding protein n=1 Tax=Pseudodesulfovibrio sediminis TaxID=2810563 RepID=A0ABM7P926_9BACT|nr:Qat anti-phage system QueC-like protein QatC [Pseudodesulfovibrio sediminis]BCS89549.1 hypothetical protein PSDVSF_27910 [Pseudodesulfovibrio sediminis]
MKVFCTPNVALNEKSSRQINTIGVNLFQQNSEHTAGLGSRLIPAVKKWHYQPTQTAWDFLSISLAVIAADTFVKRDAAAEGWTREIELIVAVYDPTPWQKTIESLEQTLRFLSGDQWRISIIGEGEPVPTVKKPQLITEDCACLFSGGLDSLIGSIDLISSGKSPALVSHAYPKDREKQVALASKVIPANLSHFIENIHPRWNGDNETSMRARSMLFLGMGILVASGLDANNRTLYIPENGFISLNIPLTTRRIASLSTKTTHPFFISSLQRIIEEAGIPVSIQNPYGFKTKGEMLAECSDQNILIAEGARSVSCGKWKRKNCQCGKCIPCIIRRAAYKAAGIEDQTKYLHPDLRRTQAYSVHSELDDLKSVQFAIAKSREANIKRMVLRSAPLRFSEVIQNSYVDVFKRGLEEIDNFIP